MNVLRPSTLDEALDLLTRADVPLTPIAGGSDLLVSWHHHDKSDLNLLDLSRLHELEEFTLADDALQLGGLTTYWQVIQSAEVSEAFPLMASSARQVGSMQIQTRGTWAGNIGNGSPAADGVPVMMAYDAVIVLQSQKGTREVLLCDYFTGYKQTVRQPDELIVAIRLPRRKRSVEWFEKVAPRRAQAITKVGVAAVCDEAGWRVVANSVAPFVCRCRTLEKSLDAGETFADPDEVRALLKPDISPIDDIRSTAIYRERVLSRVIYYRLLEANAA